MIDDWDWTARQLGFTDEKHMWEKLYVEEHRSMGLLAMLLQTGTATISRRLDMHQIPKRPRGGDNNPGWQTWKLSHFDQRVVLSCQLGDLPRLTGVSYSMWYKYRRAKGAPSGVLYSLAACGIGEVLDVVEPSPNLTADPTPQIP